MSGRARKLTPAERFVRSMATRSRRTSAGVAVLRLQDKIGKKRAVAEVAERIGKSERYVWGSVKLGAPMHALDTRFLETLEKEIARKKWSPKPQSTAGLFLFQQLQRGPRPAHIIKALAQKRGIAERTLRRAGKALGVEKRREGGRYGLWMWALSARTKEFFASALEP